MLRLPLRSLFVALAGHAVWAEARVAVTENADGFRIEIDGEWLGDYRLKGSTRPFLYPLHGPGGVPLSRTVPWPKDDPDHPHHDSFWYAHGSVNGQDLWRQVARTGRAEVIEVLGSGSGPEVGFVRTRQKLLGADGAILGTDERELRVASGTETRVLDYEVTWIASHGPLHLGATKEGAMAIRVAETLRADTSGGRVVNSAGETNGAVIQHRAPWVDFNGTIEGRTYGIALLDHPANPLHPPWWLAREYGLLSANPFGGHDFGKLPTEESELRIAAGERVTFRYRIILHRGDEKAAGIADRFSEYVRAANVPAAKAAVSGANASSGPTSAGAQR